MNSIERKLTYTVRQYERQGFYRSYFFVDAYENTRLMQSIMIDQLLNNNEFTPPEIQNLLSDFVRLQEKNIDDLKKWL